jgi:hypothetical protein
MSWKVEGGQSGGSLVLGLEVGQSQVMTRLRMWSCEMAAEEEI